MGALSKTVEAEHCHGHVAAVKNRIALAGKIEKASRFMLTNVVLESCVQINLQTTVLAIELAFSTSPSELIIASIVLSIFSAIYIMLQKGQSIKQMTAAVWPQFDVDLQQIDADLQFKVKKAVCLSAVWACICVALALYAGAKLFMAAQVCKKAVWNLIGGCVTLSPR